jgi:NADH:ubiquinone oxidoreductase subunit K
VAPTLLSDGLVPPVRNVMVLLTAVSLIGASVADAAARPGAASRPAAIVASSPTTTAKAPRQGRWRLGLRARSTSGTTQAAHARVDAGPATLLARRAELTTRVNGIHQLMATERVVNSLANMVTFGLVAATLVVAPHLVVVVVLAGIATAFGSGLIAAVNRHRLQHATEELAALQRGRDDRQEDLGGRAGPPAMPFW